jgi:hypothetical protein
MPYEGKSKESNLDTSDLLIESRLLGSNQYKPSRLAKTGLTAFPEVRPSKRALAIYHSPRFRSTVTSELPTNRPKFRGCLQRAGSSARKASAIEIWAQISRRGVHLVGSLREQKDRANPFRRKTVPEGSVLNALFPSTKPVAQKHIP